MDSVFLCILKDFLQEKNTALDAAVDWDSLLKLTKTHEVTGIVYHQCKEFIPAEMIEDFDRAYSVAIFYYHNRVKVMDRISKILSDAGIPFFSVKGLEVAKYYPVPALRTMGDNDVIVPPGRLAEAVSVLRAEGFYDSGDSNDHVWSANYNGMHFEFHDRLVEEGERAEMQMVFFNDFMPFVKDDTLDWNFHYLFLLMHLRKHFMNSGVGIRQFMDIAVMIKNGSQLDWAWINEKLLELDLDRFARTCYSLIEQWFGIKAPTGYEPLDPQLAETVTEIVIANGVFGFEVAANRDNSVSNWLIDGEGPYWKKRAVFLIKGIFPGYEHMKGYPGCGFLNGRPYLLPAAWVTRFVYISFKKNKQLQKNTVKRAFIATDDLETRKKLLEDLGLVMSQK